MLGLGATPPHTHPRLFWLQLHVPGEQGEYRAEPGPEVPGPRRTSHLPARLPAGERGPRAQLPHVTAHDRHPPRGAEEAAPRKLNKLGLGLWLCLAAPGDGRSRGGRAGPPLSWPRQRGGSTGWDGALTAGSECQARRSPPVVRAGSPSTRGQESCQPPGPEAAGRGTCGPEAWADRRATELAGLWRGKEGARPSS